MQSSTKSLIILSCTPYFGSSRFLKSLAQGINLEEIINNPSKHSKSLSLRQETIDFLNQNKYETYLKKVTKWLAKPINQILTFLDSKYPKYLKQIPNPPIILYCCGNIELLKKPQLAIVGARNNTTYGKNVTNKICTDLKNSQLSIISGLAYGIDTLAHKFAIENDLNTIAVVGTGVDIIYPSSNRDLYERLLNTNNLIISELALGTAPLRHHFPQRNRIISSLAEGVIVVEAAKKSGSLITAQLALEQNKEVFAIPGSIFSKTSDGTNELIQQGAKLVYRIDDILEEINIHSTITQKDSLPLKNSDHKDISTIEKAVLDSIDTELTTLDKIITRSKLPYSQVVSTLLELELESLVESVAGGYINIQ
ncbi:DNA-processing protein DprA [Francisella sp. 19X1-34]|uniref:DNA-processing protein DprA n=1 Tax=Francisella sp. 19X1-34 TaxID=3087177 RepID=UPI002E34F831|nr:DNA-processing protein DprA [Francisella sp. 19X1-34]MED7787749.1 DNA-processing protein DprA [Francisella sp. 19X1-34]